MKKALMLALADHMEEVARNEEERKTRLYSQATWLGGDLDQDTVALGDGFENGALRRVAVKEGACGTTACVLGHGVAVEGTGLFFYADEADILKRVDGNYEVGEVGVGFEGEDGFVYEYEAAAVAFDIPLSHAEVMFGWPGHGRTAEFYNHRFNSRNVAERLRAYVESDGDTMEAILR